MQKQDWIIEACEDLKKYAQKHHLSHLVQGLDEALDAARHDALLQSSGALQEPARSCSVLVNSIGFCKHSSKVSDDRGDSFTCGYQ